MGGMLEKRFQFRLLHLFGATTFVAMLVASVTVLPSTYYTEGALGSMFFGFLRVSFATVTGICLFFPRLRGPAFVVFLLVAGLFIYHQSTLNHRLKQLEIEVARIITYVDKFKSAQGHFPQDLSGYEFQHPELQPYVAYSPPDGNYSYQIRYHPTKDTGIGHWYFGDRGYWFEDD